MTLSEFLRVFCVIVVSIPAFCMNGYNIWYSLLNLFGKQNEKSLIPAAIFYIIFEVCMAESLKVEFKILGCFLIITYLLGIVIIPMITCIRKKIGKRQDRVKANPQKNKKDHSEDQSSFANSNKK